MAEIADDRLTIARLGGDEFAMLLRDTEGDESLLDVGRQLIAALNTDVQVDGRLVHLAGSLGLAQAPRDGLTPDALLRCADLAMYAAKRGSGGIVLFGRDIGHPAGDPVALAADLRLALGRGDVKVAVQPLVDLNDRSIHSVEILARWRHPVLGMVEPEIFVAAAERGGLTSELTRVVLHAALSACRSWAESGLEVRVAVNLAARALDDPELPVRIENALTDHGVPGRLLGIELTESTLLDNPDRVYPVLERLRGLGVQVAIDDFGTGYSSMTYVSSLAPDQVKIDKSFVQRLPLQGRDAAIVRSIIDLGQNLGVEVVAEGVSDPATAQAVKDLGCSIAQGFLYAEPMPVQALPGWVRRWIDNGPPSGPIQVDITEGQSDSPDDGGSERLRLVR
jgi:predicted signal transduction protein with EAL and GGDEF domain